MSSADDNSRIRITLEDLGGAAAPAREPAQGSATTTPAVRDYGNITAAAGEGNITARDGKGSLLLRAWFYLGVAGFVGSVLAWAICEPFFVDGDDLLEPERWGNYLLIPGAVAMICIGLGVAESIVERSVRKGLYRSALAVPLGIIFGFIFDFIANIVFWVGLDVLVNLGVLSFRNPLFWISRAVAWAAFGIVGGIVYGIIGTSLKKGLYGMLGGALGAAVGGLLFDPISIAFGGAGGISRMVGLAILGAATGAAIGIVESALKQRWLYVSAGPLAGKQFILYKDHTTLGSNQQSDIYLFKDPQILPRHAVIERRGNRLQLTADGPVYVAAQPVRGPRVLQDGDFVQIGRYGFRYREKQKS
jgi:hypothetical protein